MPQKLEVPRNYVQFLKLVKVALLDGLPEADGRKPCPRAYTCHAAQEVCQWALAELAKDAELQKVMSSHWILMMYASIHTAIQLAINPECSLDNSEYVENTTLEMSAERVASNRYRAAWVQAAIDGKHTFDGKQTIYAGLRFLREVGPVDWARDLRGEA